MLWRLTLGVLLGSVDIFLDFLFLRIIRIPPQQFLPGLYRSLGIKLALPPNHTQVEQSSRMIRPILQSRLKLGDGSIGISRVPQRGSEIG